MGEYTAAARAANAKVRWARVDNRTAETAPARAARIREDQARTVRVDRAVEIWAAGSTGSRAEAMRRERIAGEATGRRRERRAELRRTVAKALEELVVLGDAPGGDPKSYDYAVAVADFLPEVHRRMEESRRTGVDVLYPWALGYLAAALADVAAGIPLTAYRAARCAALADLTIDANAGDLAMAAVVERAR